MSGAAVEDESSWLPRRISRQRGGGTRQWASGTTCGADARPDFDSGSAATNSIELTKRIHTVSLTKQGAATGNLRINLSWRMRTSDIGGGQQRGSLLRHPFKTFKPDVVQAHTQSMVKCSILDLGVMYELADGSKGVVQPLATSSATSTTRRT